MKQFAVPADLTRHLMQAWPQRKLISQRALLPVGDAAEDPAAFLGQIETDVAVQVAIGLTHDQWVMLVSSGPQWWLHPDGLHPVDLDAKRPWDREREPFDTLSRHAVLECEVTGWAIPTFLDAQLWPLAPEDDTPLPVYENGG